MSNQKNELACSKNILWLHPELWTVEEIERGYPETIKNDEEAKTDVGI